jgi:hypothetical protein
MRENAGRRQLLRSAESLFEGSTEGDTDLDRTRTSAIKVDAEIVVLSTTERDFLSIYTGFSTSA